MSDLPFVVGLLVIAGITAFLANFILSPVIATVIGLGAVLLLISVYDFGED